jgi:hypothetical protein
MNLRRFFARPNPARELALIGARQRDAAWKALRNARVNQLRAEMGLAPDPRL